MGQQGEGRLKRFSEDQAHNKLTLSISWFKNCLLLRFLTSAIKREKGEKRAEDRERRTDTSCPAKQHFTFKVSGAGCKLRQAGLLQSSSEQARFPPVISLGAHVSVGVTCSLARPAGGVLF
jgi:hypothetical protein